MLGHARTGSGGDEHRGSLNVERVGAVAAGADDVENSRITCAAAVISPMVSFFTRKPMVRAAIITGDISPLMILRNSDSISS